MNTETDRGTGIQARIREHWEASERADIDAEHATDPFDPAPGRAALAEPIPAD